MHFFFPRPGLSSTSWIWVQEIWREIHWKLWLHVGSGKGLIQYKKQETINKEWFEEESRKQRGETNMTERVLASLQVCCSFGGGSQAIPSSHLISSPSTTHHLRGIQTHRSLQQLSDRRRCGADIPAFRAEAGAALLGRRSEPSRGRSNDCLTSVSHPPTSWNLTAPRCLH